MLEKFALRRSLQSPFAAAFVVFSLLAIPAFSQTGTIQGTVADPSGASVGGAKVTAVDQGKGITVRQTPSEANGEFHIGSLGPGTYSLKIEAQGFKSIERKGLVLDVNQTLNVEPIRLEVGSVSDSVVVDATTPEVETATADHNFVITSKEVTEQSLNGRDWQSLLRTLPGIVSNDTSDFRLAFNNTDSFNVNGLRGSNNNVFLDGSINTDVGANDGQYTQLSLDAVSEFKVQTSVFNAEYGRNPGVLISAITKSGNSSFHGTAYEFLRNSAMDANSFFNNLQGRPKSPLHFNQFGGNIGGWLWVPKVSTPSNKKIFFFYNFEGTRASRPNGRSYYDTPSAALLGGDFSSAIKPGTSLNGSEYPIGTVFQPGTVKRDASNNIIGGTPYPNNVVPASQFSVNGPAFSKVMQSALRGTSLPPSPAIQGYVRVPFQDTYVFHKNQNAARGDYNLNSKVSLFFRWVDDAQQESQGYGIFSGNSFPVFPEYRKKPGASWSANMVNVISPTLTNETIFTYNHLTQVVNQNNLQPSQYTESALGFKFQDLFPSSNTLNRLPSFNCGSSCGVSPFPPNWVSEGKTFAVTDNVSKVIGSHALKFGIFWNKNVNGQQPYWTDAPNFNFGSSYLNPNDTGNPIANMLLGNYSTLSQSNGRFYGDFHFIQVEAYAQDSWKVNKRFTVEYGMRWVYPGPTSTYGPYLQYYFDPASYNPSQAVKLQLTGPFAGSIIPGSGNAANGMQQEGKGTLPLGGVEHRYSQWGPRLGFAYDVFADGKTSVRGGAGIFYERIRQNHNSFDGLGNYPLLYTPTLYGGNVDNVSTSLVSSGIQYTSGIIAENRNGKIPTIYSWSLGVQHQLPWQIALDVAYVGNAARHLQYTYDLNEVPLGTTTGPNNILKTVNGVNNAIRPYLGYNSVNYTDFGANSNYNALQTRVTRRFGKNFTLNSDFTWAKAMDIVDSDTTNIDYWQNRQFNYGPSGFNRKFAFNVNYVYELPTLKNQNLLVRSVAGGWEVTGITRFWSGFPLTIYSGGNQGTLGGSVRADYVGGSTSGNGTWQQYFNPLVFAQPADGALGNTGRGILTGPGISNWDFSLFKNTHIGEHVNTQLRIETFNLFNHTQFSGINTSASASGPGAPVTPATINGLGQVNSTRDPRTLQIGLKVLF